MTYTPYLGGQLEKYLHEQRRKETSNKNNLVQEKDDEIDEDQKTEFEQDQEQ